MTILAIALKYLRGRLIASVLTAVSVALGVGLVIASMLMASGIREAFVASATDYNLVVGAKGSPMQLVLGVVFRIDVATPNIRYTTYEALREDPRVEVAVPVMVGDAYQGFRYVATNAAYFAALPWRRRSFALAVGRQFHDDAPDAPAFEALLGAEAARSTGLRIGDRFSEGEEMAEYPFTVVGILKPTHSADDRAIFMSLASFWQMNEVAREQTIKPLTAVLIRPKRMSDLPGLHRERNVVGRDAGGAAERRDPDHLQHDGGGAGGADHDPGDGGRDRAALCVRRHVQRHAGAPARDRHDARAGGAARHGSRHRPARIGHARRDRRHRRDHWRTCRRHSRGRRAVDQKRPGHRAVRVRLRLEPVILAAVIVLGTMAGLLPAVLAYRMEVTENLAPLS